MSRLYLKTIVVVISIIAIIPLCTSIEASADEKSEFIDDDMFACYSIHDSITGYSGPATDIECTVNAAAAVGIWDCVWNDIDDKWTYNFNIGGMGISNDREVFDAASIEIKGPDNSEIIILDKLHTDYTWSTPSSEFEEIQNKDKLSNLVIDVILSIIGGPIEDIWSASNDVISIMGNELDDFDYSDNYRRYYWTWDPLINKTCQQVRIVAEMEPETTQSFTAEYTLYGDIFDSFTLNKFTLTMTAPKTPLEGPSALSESEREANGIKTVNKEELVSYAISIGMPEEVVSAIQGLNEEELYFSNNTVTCTIDTMEYGTHNLESPSYLQTFLDYGDLYYLRPND